MELTLAAVTIVSLLMALGMGIVTWRLLGEERRRSAARVAALLAELGEDAAGPPRASRADSDSAGEDAGRRGWQAQAAGLAAASGLVLAVALVAVIGFGGAGGDSPGSPAGAASAAPAAQIELLALEHEPAGAVLAITGSIRATAAAAAEPLAVLATALDAGGTPVARRQADLPALAPGAVAAFAVDVPAAGVSRYRISFLRDEATLPHVDRRAAAGTGETASEALDAPGGAW